MAVTKAVFLYTCCKVANRTFNNTAPLCKVCKGAIKAFIYPVVIYIVLDLLFYPPQCFHTIDHSCTVIGVTMAVKFCIPVQNSKGNTMAMKILYFCTVPVKQPPIQSLTELYGPISLKI